MALGGTPGGGSSRAIEAGRAFVRVYAKDDLTAQIKTIATKFNAVGSAFMKGGGTLAAPFLAALPLLVGAFDRLGELSRMDKVAKAFGITGEAATGLLGVLRSIGSETKEDIEGLTQFSAKVQEAIDGKMDGEAGKLFDGLSVRPQDLAGLAVDEQFYRVLGAIRQLPQSVQLFKLSMLGGTDSMKKWIPLLSMSEGEVRRLAKTMEVSQQELNSASRAMGAVSLATALFGRTWDLIAVGVAPVVETLATEVAKLLIPVNEWLKKNRELVGIGVSVVAAVGAVGLAMLSAGIVFKATAFAVTGLIEAFKALRIASIALNSVKLAGAWISFLLAPEVLPFTVAAAAVTAALVGIGYVFFTQTELGRTWASSLSSYFAQTKDNAVKAWTGIADALRAGDLELAWSIVTATIGLEWERLAMRLLTNVGEVVDFFRDGWDSALYVTQNSWVNFIAGFKKLWVDAVGFLGQHLGDEISAIFNRLAQIPGLGNVFSAINMGFNVVAKNGDAFKAEADRERDKELKRLNDELTAAKEMRQGAASAIGAAAAERIRSLELLRDRLTAEAARKAAAKDNVAGIQDAVNRMATAAGMFSAPNGLLAQAFGIRSISPQVAEQKKTNVILERISDQIVRKGPMVFT